MIDPATREMPGPGVYRGIPAPHYHGWPAASSTSLRVLAEEGKAPAHLKRKLDHPDDYGSAAAKLGSLAHVLVLQPELCDDLYAKRPPGRANSNAYKAAEENLLADRPFVTLMKREEIAQAYGILEAIENHPLAQHLFVGGETELTLVWDEPETGVRCKARLDSLVEGITDLKTTGDTSDRALRRVIGNKRYDLQASFYLRGAYALWDELAEMGHTLPEVDPFSFCFVEADEPHDIRIFTPKSLTLGNAEDEIGELLRIWAHCQATDTWPTSPARVEELPEPGWLNHTAEERLRKLAEWADLLAETGGWFG